MEEEKSKVLVVGATGKLGREMVMASVAASHPTYALVRDLSIVSSPSSSNSDKWVLLQSFLSHGVHLLQGSFDDYESLIEAVKQVDVVICAVPSKNALEQKPLIRAIKEAGCIKRFIPSEFGADPTKVQILGMDYDFYEKKAEMRQFIESEGIPHTYISCNFLMRYLLPSLVQPGLDSPPRDEIKIFGDGNTKAIFVKDCDVAKFTLCAIDDPRTLNKTLYLRPPGNICSMHELVDMWEHKIRKALRKIYISKEELLKAINGTPYPKSMDMIFIYSAFVKGDNTYFDIDSSGVEATHLYPHVRYTTVSQYLDTLV
ncbi:pinoresinol reductase 1 [Rhynchospora pubera]|uniref:Pinoresinol reductase 1 n=1 Tax=Rhynchospora pubera TaxID=906938 RepID=A0AAV8F7T5_9POAL|nr:pinoresinol reductase 1 [Rhynchospora pubera]